MHSFADRLMTYVSMRGNPCVVGLDPRLDRFPRFARQDGDRPRSVRESIVSFNRAVLDAVAPLVPAVKLQIAFYEQYGILGLQAFEDTIQEAKARDVLVLVDAKRNDIGSTAQAYAAAFLAPRWSVPGGACGFDVDAITVSPFLGFDSLEPFVSACIDHGKGIFILVKTSNPGAADVQGRVLADGRSLSTVLAEYVDSLGRRVMGTSGYSSVGAVVGATYPEEARVLRALMPRAWVLVPGYGAQGGRGTDAAASFNPDGLGAIVNASRSITYAFGANDVSREDYLRAVKAATQEMIQDVVASLGPRIGR